MKINLFAKIYKNSYAKTMDFIQDDIIPKFKTKEEAYFYDQFKQYLEAEDILFCYQMVEEGFKASAYQKEKMQNILIIKCENNEYRYKEIQNLKDISLPNKMKLLIHCLPRNYLTIQNFTKNSHGRENDSDKIILDFFDSHNNKEMFLNHFKQTFKSLKSYYASGLDSSNDFYKHRVSDIEIVRTQYEKTLYVASVLFKHEVLKPEEINTIKNIVKNVSDYMVKKTSKTYSGGSFSRIGKDNLDNFLDLIGVVQKASLSKDNKKDILLKQLKSYNFRNKSLTEEIKELVNREEYSLEDLPMTAQEKIKNINKINQELNNIETKDFLNERLPVILKKYFSIDKEYRTILKNVEGFNATELMIQALDNIELMLVAKKEDNNYDLVSELSVENRKLKLKAV